MTTGISVFPHNGTDAASLLANAGAALFRAKAKSRGSIGVYEPEMDQQIRDRRVLHQDLSLAIKNGELSLYYQPQAASGHTVASSEVIGFEALARWLHPVRGYVPPSDKINMAFVGVGDQGLRVMLRFLREPDVQGVAVCDVNESGNNYPQWDSHEFCKSVRSLLGVDSGWDWLSPDQPIELTHTLRVTGGVAGRESCQKIVDAYNGTQNRSGSSRGSAAYVDFRELLEKQKDLDAVVVGTTDNLHAAVSAAAMKKGKHVFCQKPLTHTIYEARRIAEIAKETGVATQIAGSSSAGFVWSDNLSVEFKATGSTFALYIGGGLALSGSDTHIAAAGAVGVRFYDSNSSAKLFSVGGSGGSAVSAGLGRLTVSASDTSPGLAVRK